MQVQRGGRRSALSSDKPNRNEDCSPREALLYFSGITAGGTNIEKRVGYLQAPQSTIQEEKLLAWQGKRTIIPLEKTRPALPRDYLGKEREKKEFPSTHEVTRVVQLRGYINMKRFWTRVRNKRLLRQASIGGLQHARWWGGCFIRGEKRKGIAIDKTSSLRREMVFAQQTDQNGDSGGVGGDLPGSLGRSDLTGRQQGAPREGENIYLSWGGRSRLRNSGKKWPLVQERKKLKYREKRRVPFFSRGKAPLRSKIWLTL